VAGDKKGKTGIRAMLRKGDRQRETKGASPVVKIRITLFAATGVGQKTIGGGRVSITYGGVLGTGLMREVPPFRKQRNGAKTQR